MDEKRIRDAKGSVLLAIKDNRIRRLEVARLLAAAGLPCTFEREPLRICEKVEQHPGRVIVLDRDGYPKSFLRALDDYQYRYSSLVIVYLCDHAEEARQEASYHGRRVSFVEYGKVPYALVPSVRLAKRESGMIGLDLSDYQMQHPFLVEAKNSMRETSKKEGTDLARKERNNGISRRQFLQGSAAAAAVLGISSLAGCATTDEKETTTQGTTLEEVPTTEAPTYPGPYVEEQLFSTPCRSNCFQGCRLNAHVRDGKVVRMSPAAQGAPEQDPDGLYTGCCLKGLSIPNRTYSNKRIKYPMRRAGERGEGKWERITWDEAVQEIATKFMDIQKTYGDQAICVDTGSGNYGLLNGVLGMVNRFAYALGATKPGTSYDQALGYGTDRAIGGGVWLHGNEPTDFLNSKTVFVWGSNPVHAQPQNWRILAKAKSQGTKLICIDPIRSATATKCDEYVSIQPGTDLLLTMAMMKVVLEEGWTDEEFMKTRSTCPALVSKEDGKYLMKSAVVGLADGETDDDYYVWDLDAKKAVLTKEATNPALEGTFTVDGKEYDTAFTLLKARIMETDVDYAAKKTGISKDKIKELTEAYAKSGATGIYTNYGIDHYQNGHLWGFAICCLGTLTGNIGRKGCSLSGLYVSSSITFNYTPLYVSNGKLANGVVPLNGMGELIKTQKLFGKDYPVKALYTTNANSMSNFAGQKQWFDDILPNIDYWVVHDFEMTDCAQYADIVLPAAFWLEVEDVKGSMFAPFITVQEKAIEPLYESKSDVETYRLIATAMGLGQFFPDQPDEEWIKLLFDLPLFTQLGMTWDVVKAAKTVRTAWNGNPFVRGESAAFPVPQGRVRVYCDTIAPRTNWGQEIDPELLVKERMPYFKAPNEAWDENPLYKKYPLVYIQDHTRFRVHSQWFDTPNLRELDPEPYIRMNPDDATARGLKEGDIAEMFNDRGHAVAKLRLDPAVKPGVATMPKGWQRNQFIEGCFQEMTNGTSDPLACNFAFFDALVDVRKYEGGK